MGGTTKNVPEWLNTSLIQSVNENVEQLEFSFIATE